MLLLVLLVKIQGILDMIVLNAVLKLETTTLLGSLQQYKNHVIEILLKLEAMFF